VYSREVRGFLTAIVFKGGAFYWLFGEFCWTNYLLRSTSLGKEFSRKHMYARCLRG